jgi:hypothetical protein
MNICVAVIDGFLCDQGSLNSPLAIQIIAKHVKKVAAEIKHILVKIIVSHRQPGQEVRCRLGQEVVVQL